MNFTVKNPTVPMVNELARLSYNLVYFMNIWTAGTHPEQPSREDMRAAQKEMNAWVLKNIDLSSTKKDI